MPASINPIRRLLVANRGEIACRIIKTAKRMNIETMAVYSEADRDAMHVHLADQAHQLGSGSEPQKSYLNQEELLQLAHFHQANAVHPGYGFLSENSEFAARCREEKLIFVGPKPESIRSMGIKNESKRIMIAAEVPVVPGYHGDDQTDERLMAEADNIGFPVLIKPVRGGGGKGMRIVRSRERFMAELESSRRESLKAFNDHSMLLEKYIERPRHIEVQVFGDHQGNYVHLFERDCSVQRRHQKIIEEAPAPLLDWDKRHELGSMAVAAARAVDYVGAGTVEFIMDRDSGQFYFMEMNTRLQVEHPITELITSTDLVEWQLRVASGEKLPRQQSQITLHGHAFEARIYAENPDDNFLPQTGRLDYLSLPGQLEATDTDQCLVSLGKAEAAIRLDTGVRQGDYISPFYDPMLAKLVVWGPNRVEALERMRRALADYVVIGLPTNIAFLERLVANRSFSSADVGTDFIEVHETELFPRDTKKPHESKFPSSRAAQVAASVFALTESELVSRERTISSHPQLTAYRALGHQSPTYELSDFRIGSLDPIRVLFKSLGADRGELTVLATDEAILFKGLVSKSFGDDRQMIIRLNECKDSFKFAKKSPILSEKNQTRLLLRNESLGETNEIKLTFDDPLARSDSAQEGPAGDDPLQARAPMPGIVEKVLVGVGDRVEEGQNLIILSAMKMEYAIRSATSGTVEQILHRQGDFVAKGSLLLCLKSI